MEGRVLTREAAPPTPYPQLPVSPPLLSPRSAAHPPSPPSRHPSLLSGPSSAAGGLGTRPVHTPALCPRPPPSSAPSLPGLLPSPPAPSFSPQNPRALPCSPLGVRPPSRPLAPFLPTLAAAPPPFSFPRRPPPRPVPWGCRPPPGAGVRRSPSLGLLFPTRASLFSGPSRPLSPAPRPLFSPPRPPSPCLRRPPFPRPPSPSGLRPPWGRAAEPESPSWTGLSDPHFLSLLRVPDPGHRLKGPGRPRVQGREARRRLRGREHSAQRHTAPRSTAAQGGPRPTPTSPIRNQAPRGPEDQHPPGQRLRGSPDLGQGPPAPPAGNRTDLQEQRSQPGWASVATYWQGRKLQPSSRRPGIVHRRERPLPGAGERLLVGEGDRQDLQNSGNIKDCPLTST